MPMFPSAQGFMPIKRWDVPDLSAAAYRDNAVQNAYEKQKWDVNKTLMQEGASLGKSGYDAYSAWKGRQPKGIPSATPAGMTPQAAVGQAVPGAGQGSDALRESLLRNKYGKTPTTSFGGNVGSAVGQAALGGLEQGIDGLGDPQASNSPNPSYRNAHDKWRAQVKNQEQGVDQALQLIGMTNPYAAAVTSVMRMLT